MEVKMKIVLFAFISLALSLPAQRKKGRNGAKGAANLNQIRGNGKGLQQNQALAGDASTVVEKIVAPSPGNPTKLQFRVSVPKQQNPSDGLNVLLHGDGAASFFAFPNAKQANGLNGVVVLAPNAQLKWGGVDAKRSDGPAHVKLVADLIQNVLPQMLQFDQKKVFFTGVSGGSLTLTSAMIPLFGDQFNAGMFILCGGLIPPNGIPAGSLPQRIHFQTTTDELASLKKTIPPTIQAVEDAANQDGRDLSNFTVDGSPNGGHCAFDGQGFNSGIQLMVNNFGKVMFNKQGVAGVTTNQLKSIVGNENPYQ
ncbi:hypothetical protein HDV04_005710 [Boothiomyces sp. JEL0838]|nr:hypothetical protein HDV04_005710 [Boothiomyces sp. JEL0838]